MDQEESNPANQTESTKSKAPVKPPPPYLIPWIARVNKEQCVTEHEFRRLAALGRTDAVKEEVKNAIIEYIQSCAAHHDKNARTVITVTRYRQTLKCFGCEKVTSYLVRCRPTDGSDPNARRHSICFTCLSRKCDDYRGVACPADTHKEAHTIGFFPKQFEPLLFCDYKAFFLGILECADCNTYVGVREYDDHPNTCSGRFTRRSSDNSHSSPEVSQLQRKNEKLEKRIQVLENDVKTLEETKKRYKRRIDSLKRRCNQNQLDDDEDNEFDETNEENDNNDTNNEKCDESRNEESNQNLDDMSPIHAEPLNDDEVLDLSDPKDLEIAKLTKQLEDALKRQTETEKRYGKAMKCVKKLGQGLHSLDLDTASSAAKTLNEMMVKVDLLAAFQKKIQNDIFKVAFDKHDLIHNLKVFEALREGRLYRRMALPPPPDTKEFIINPFKVRPTVRLPNPEQYSADISVYDQRFPGGVKTYRINGLNERIGGLRAQIRSDINYNLKDGPLFLAVTGTTFYGPECDAFQLQDILFTKTQNNHKRAEMAVQILTADQLLATHKPGSVPAVSATYVVQQKAVFEGPPPYDSPLQPADLIAACKQEAEMRELAYISREEAQVTHYSEAFETLGCRWVNVADQTRRELQDLVELLLQHFPVIKDKLTIPELSLSSPHFFPQTRWRESPSGRAIPPESAEWANAIDLTVTADPAVTESDNQSHNSNETIPKSIIDSEVGEPNNPGDASKQPLPPSKTQTTTQRMVTSTPHKKPNQQIKAVHSSESNTTATQPKVNGASSSGTPHKRTSTDRSPVPKENKPTERQSPAAKKTKRYPTRSTKPTTEAKALNEKAAKDPTFAVTPVHRLNPERIARQGKISTTPNVERRLVYQSSEDEEDQPLNGETHNDANPDHESSDGSPGPEPQFSPEDDPNDDPTRSQEL